MRIYRKRSLRIISKKPRTFSFDLIKGKQVKVTYFSGYWITGIPVQNYPGSEGTIWFSMTDCENEEGKQKDQRVTLSNVKNIKFI